MNRHGQWFDVAADGTTSTYEAPWDWDSVSNPERANYDSDLWVIVTSPSPGQWAHDSAWGDRSWGDAPMGFGHDCLREEVDAVKGLLSQWKGNHNRIRAVIWADDDVTPDGTWGQWGTRGASRVPARQSTFRYWEP